MPDHLPELEDLDITGGHIYPLVEFRVSQDLEGVTRPTGRMHYFVMALPATIFETVLPIFHIV